MSSHVVYKRLRLGAVIIIPPDAPESIEAQNFNSEGMLYLESNVRIIVNYLRDEYS
ncbi:hypothetical protein D3C80_720680 [compost metagenome]